MEPREAGRQRRNAKSNNNKKQHSKRPPQQQQPVDQQQDIHANDSNNNNDDPDDPEWESQGKPYRVKVSPVMGRYLIAARDIAPGELILHQEALVVGPCQNTKPVCLGCLKPFDGEQYIRSSEIEDCHRCMGCQWPLCSPACPGLALGLGHGLGHGHAEEECAALRAAGPSGRRVLRLQARTPLYNVVVPLRILLLRAHDPSRWKAVRRMQSHDEVRRQLPAVWQANQLGVVDRIRSEFGLREFDEDEIHSVCGILEVNAFEVGEALRALYDEAFLLSHDCTPNTSHSDDDRRTLFVRASVAIPRGRAITLSYAYTIQGTLKRREHLKESKFFDCCCPRCGDPTELGSMCSAMVCPGCGRPSVLPVDPLQAGSPWRCGPHGLHGPHGPHAPPRARSRAAKAGPPASTPSPPACPGHEMTGEQAKEFIDKLADESEALDPNDVAALEAFLCKYAPRLHPDHYAILGAKHSLSQVYGKVHGYLIHQLPDALLERKLSICRDILRVFDILEPGVSRLRGITLYEMHAPIMVLTTRQFEANAITRKDLRARLREVAVCLEQAAHILGLEPESSSEGAMGRAAQDALERVRQWQ